MFFPLANANLSVPTHSERIRHAIDVIEPTRNQCNLQNSLIIEPHFAQRRMILTAEQEVASRVILTTKSSIARSCRDSGAVR